VEVHQKSKMDAQQTRIAVAAQDGYRLKAL
jgi:hypothetical protein